MMNRSQLLHCGFLNVYRFLEIDNTDFGVYYYYQENKRATPGCSQKETFDKVVDSFVLFIL